MTLSTTQFSHPKYRADIDGLRAIAVLSVVAFHAFPEWLHGGFIGVDIFFVISGFLISTIVFENLEKDSFSFLEFYRRRIRRIFPALMLVLTACLVFGWFALFPDEFQQLGRHVLAGAGFVSNLVLWNESGYFDSASETKPLLHLWSLGIEEQFYLVWPLMAWLAWRRRFSLLVLTATALGVSLLLNLWGVGKDAVGTFYSPLTRFWELLGGTLLAWFVLNRRDALDRLRSIELNTLSALGLTLLGGGVVAMTSKLPFPGWWALLPVLGAALTILAGPTAWLNRTLLSNRVMVWIGLISFPLYLWHWPILSFVSIIKGKDLNQDTRLIAVALAVLLAWLTYKLLEKPIRRNGTNRSAWMLALVALIVGACGGAAHLFGNLQRPTDSSVLTFNKEVREQFVIDKWAYEKNDLCLQQYPMPNLSSFAWWFCMKSQEKSPTLLLLGNSYANHLYPGFAFNKKLAHHSVLSIGTCDVGTPTGAPTQNKKHPCDGENYAHQVAFIDELIRSSRTIQYIVIDGLAPQPDAEYIARVKRRIDFLEWTGAHVIVFTPHIRPGFDLKACFARPLRSKGMDCSFASTERQKMKDQFQPFVAAISTSNPRVLFFDQNDMYCEGEKCAYVSNGLPLHRDKAHLSEYGSIKLQEYFTRWAEKNIPQIFQAP